MKNSTLSLSLTLLLLSQVACSQRRALRQEEKEVALLAEAAGSFWQALRWERFEIAAAFYEDPEVSMSWLEHMQEEEVTRYTAAELLRVELGPKPDEEEELLPGEPQREGTVWVRTESFQMPEQILDKETLTQPWYLSQDRWYVDPEAWEEDPGAAAY